MCLLKVHKFLVVISYAVLIKNSGNRMENWIRGYKHLLLLQRIWVQFPVPHGGSQSFAIPISKNLNPLLPTMGIRHAYGTHTHMQAKTKENKKTLTHIK